MQPRLWWCCVSPTPPRSPSPSFPFFEACCWEVLLALPFFGVLVLLPSHWRVVLHFPLVLWQRCSLPPKGRKAAPPTREEERSPTAVDRSCAYSQSCGEDHPGACAAKLRPSRTRSIESSTDCQATFYPSIESSIRGRLTTKDASERPLKGTSLTISRANESVEITWEGRAFRVPMASWRCARCR